MPVQIQNNSLLVRCWTGISFSRSLRISSIWDPKMTAVKMIGSQISEFSLTRTWLTVHHFCLLLIFYNLWLWVASKVMKVEHKLFLDFTVNNLTFQLIFHSQSKCWSLRMKLWKVRLLVISYKNRLNYEFILIFWLRKVSWNLLDSPTLWPSFNNSLEES